MKNINVEWTGKYPTKCFGRWIITVDGKSFPIPTEIVNENMGTYGNYATWHFEENWQEVFTDYNDGMNFDEWIEKNINWIQKGLVDIGMSESFTQDDLYNLYNSIQENDWRHNSCGGCI